MPAYSTAKEYFFSSSKLLILTLLIALTTVYGRKTKTIQPHVKVIFLYYIIIVIINFFNRKIDENGKTINGCTKTSFVQAKSGA